LTADELKPLTVGGFENTCKEFSIYRDLGLYDTFFDTVRSEFLKLLDFEKSFIPQLKTEIEDEIYEHARVYDLIPKKVEITITPKYTLKDFRVNFWDYGWPNTYTDRSFSPEEMNANQKRGILGRRYINTNITKNRGLQLSIDLAIQVSVTYQDKADCMKSTQSVPSSEEKACQLEQQKMAQRTAKLKGEVSLKNGYQDRPEYIELLKGHELDAFQQVKNEGEKIQLRMVKMRSDFNVVMDGATGHYRMLKGNCSVDDSRQNVDVQTKPLLCLYAENDKKVLDVNIVKFARYEFRYDLDSVLSSLGWDAFKPLEGFDPEESGAEYSPVDPR
jgi:hypothetical protein